MTTVLSDLRSRNKRLLAAQFATNRTRKLTKVTAEKLLIRAVQVELNHLAEQPKARPDQVYAPKYELNS